MQILGLVENMSGLICPHCGGMIELFKTKGGMLTAKKENLRLLGSLPFEPKVVQNGDIGNMDLLDNDQLLISQEFSKIVDAIVESPVPRQDFIAKSQLEKEFPVREKDSGNGKTVVVPVSGGKLAAHFGHCEEFAFIETENGIITETEMMTPPAHEPGVLPQWLYEQGADVVIVGGMGERAQQLIRDNGIEVIIGAPMDSPESLTNQYLTGNLITGENVCDH
jgi:predicted Fe-Mo cluster-binding NifX family protein